MTKSYTAGKTRANRPGWSVTFRHPLRSDSRGKFGLKIRKGLGTSDDSTADVMIEQLNILLADQYWWSIDRKNDAESQFDPKTVKIFYEGIESAKVEPAENAKHLYRYQLKMKAIQLSCLPVPLVPVKPALLRHLIGAHHKKDKFPSTSTLRTTTADVKVITTDDEVDFTAAVMFMSEYEVRAHIDECIEEACLAAAQGANDEKIAKSLLSHRENRFRLFYLLGSWPDHTVDDPEEDHFTFDDDQVVGHVLPGEEAVDQDEARLNAQNLRGLCGSDQVDQ